MSACPNENLKMLFFLFDLLCPFRTWVHILLYLVPLSKVCIFQKPSNATIAPGQLSGLFQPCQFCFLYILCSFLILGSRNFSCSFLSTEHPFCFHFLSLLFSVHLCRAMFKVFSFNMPGQGQWNCTFFAFYQESANT